MDAKPGDTARTAQNIVAVKSMSLAAWFITKGLRLVSGKRQLDRPKEFEFLFEDPEQRIEKLAMEFMTSECRSFDHAVRDLRGLVNASKPKQQPK